MSFSRLPYDQQAYQKEIQESSEPGNYRLHQPVTACNPCHPDTPFIRLNSRGKSLFFDNSQVDIDSELIGITRKLSDDPNKRYQPLCPDSVCTSGEPCGQGVTALCKVNGRPVNSTGLPSNNCFQPSETTRLSNPPCTLRGTGWNRWEWLALNPQDSVLQPFSHPPIQYRTVAKDNHRPCIPTPLDQNILPPKDSGDLPCEQIYSTCAAFTHSDHKF